jgi:hypothetical protein
MTGAIFISDNRKSRRRKGKVDEITGVRELPLGWEGGDQLLLKITLELCLRKDADV